MITAFATPQGRTCPACVVNAHGSLTVQRHHGATVACDYTGTPLTEDATGTTPGTTIVAVQGKDVKEGDHCIQCGQGLKITGSVWTRVLQSARVRLSHRRRPAPRTGGVIDGVTAGQPSGHGSSRPAPRPVQA